MRNSRVGPILSLVLLTLGCTMNPVPISTPSAATGHATVAEPVSTPAAVTAEAQNGLFKLDFVLDSATWPANKPITGSSKLERIGEGEFISGCGPLSFSFSEVGGSRHMEPEWPGCCKPYDLSQGDAITSPLTKSGATSRHDPDFEFWRAFFEGPDIRLPAGTWEITAVTSFNNGPDCSGSGQNLSASLVVTVEP